MRSKKLASQSSTKINPKSAFGDVDQQIVAENIRALQPIYAAAMLEELTAFQVVDRLVELFQQGTLPIGNNKTGSRLFKYWSQTKTRLSETDRRLVYARTFGVPAGTDTQIVTNRDFNDLWIRFISSVSALARQAKTTQGEINQEDARAAARDLASNLSLHGFGWVAFAATELQRQIDDALQILSAADVQAAYGARDVWQVIERVATNELGGARNSQRYRTMALAGSTIIRWLADNSRKFTNPRISLLNLAALRDQRTAKSGTLNKLPSGRSSNRDLINACEQWLAVASIPDDLVDYTSQPHTG